MKGKAMRLLHNAERAKRGCKYCAEIIPPDRDDRYYRRLECPHKQCPYHDLDDTNSYSEYMEKSNMIGLEKILEELG